MNLTQTRKAIAGELTSALRPVLAGPPSNARVTVHAYRPLAVRAGDGWLVLTRIEPATFGTCLAYFDALVCIGTDEQAAEQALDAFAVALVDVLGQRAGTPTSVTPQSLVIGGSELFCLAGSFLAEVTQQ